MHELSRFRDYKYTSLRDLLRVIRNKRGHFYEMSEDMQRQMGPLPEGFLRCGAHACVAMTQLIPWLAWLELRLEPPGDACCSYFTQRFPGLFMACYSFALQNCSESGPVADLLPLGARNLMTPFLHNTRAGCGVR